MGLGQPRQAQRDSRWAQLLYLSLSARLAIEVREGGIRLQAGDWLLQALLPNGGNLSCEVVVRSDGKDKS